MDRRWLFLVASVVSGACGGRTELGDGGESAIAPPSCEGPGRCGGEVVGRWRAVSTCTDLGFVRAVLPCDEVELREQTPMIWGYKTYSGEGRYSSSIGYAGSVRMFVPESCADLRGDTASCSALQAVILRRGELLLSEVACGASDGGCICDAALLPFEYEVSGTYTAEDGHLTEGSGNERDYCVEGGILWVSAGESPLQVFVRE